MPCPFLEEILMVYCRAYPVRKPVPKHQITTESPCMGEGYKACPLYQREFQEVHAPTGVGSLGGDEGEPREEPRGGDLT